MKIERYSNKNETSSFWVFIQQTLEFHPILEATEYTDNYGTHRNIVPRKRTIFNWGRPILAKIYTKKVLLHQVQYLSDIEQLVLNYEKTFDKEITIEILD